MHYFRIVTPWVVLGSPQGCIGLAYSASGLDVERLSVWEERNGTTGRNLLWNLVSPEPRVWNYKKIAIVGEQTVRVSAVLNAEELASGTSIRRYIQCTSTLGG